MPIPHVRVLSKNKRYIIDSKCLVNGSLNCKIARGGLATHQIEVTNRYTYPVYIKATSTVATTANLGFPNSPTTSTWSIPLVKIPGTARRSGAIAVPIGAQLVKSSANAKGPERLVTTVTLFELGGAGRLHVACPPLSLHVGP
jgi:hypothetical protein